MPQLLQHRQLAQDPAPHRDTRVGKRGGGAAMLNAATTCHKGEGERAATGSSWSRDQGWAGRQQRGQGRAVHTTHLGGTPSPSSSICRARGKAPRNTPTPTPTCMRSVVCVAQSSNVAPCEEGGLIHAGAECRPRVPQLRDGAGARQRSMRTGSHVRGGGGGLRCVEVGGGCDARPEGAPSPDSPSGTRDAAW